MRLNKNKIINSLLCGNNIKFPMYNSHYITGKDIWLFSNIACIENTLTALTCNLKQGCKNVTSNMSNNFLKK